MAGVNTEAVRNWLEIVAGRPPEHAELVTLVDGVWDPDCDWYPVRRWAESAPCHGAGAVLAVLERFWDAWEDWRTTTREIEEIDDERVLVAWHLTARGRSSGVPLDGELFHAYWMRHGRILRGEDHLTERGTRRALGLEETG